MDKINYLFMDLLKERDGEVLRMIEKLWLFSW